MEQFGWVRKAEAAAKLTRVSQSTWLCLRDYRETRRLVGNNWQLVRSAALVGARRRSLAGLLSACVTSRPRGGCAARFSRLGILGAIYRCHRGAKLFRDFRALAATLTAPARLGSNVAAEIGDCNPSRLAASNDADLGIRLECYRVRLGVGGPYRSHSHRKLLRWCLASSPAYWATQGQVGYRGWLTRSCSWRRAGAVWLSKESLRRS